MSDATGKVIFLAFKSPAMQDDMMAFRACAHCRNKTFTITEDHVGGFPLMRCAACGSHMGRVGWADDD